MDRQAANAVERFDPEGCKSPEGEWRRWERQAEPGGGSATGLRREAAATGANRGAVAEPKGRTGTEAIWKEAK